MKIDRFGCGLELKFDAGEGSQVGTFEGYGSIFGNVDQGGDVVEKGAFKETLREWKRRGKLPKMMLLHGGFIGPAEDGIPVGKYSVMEEDDKGLFLKGSLFALDTQKGKYIYEGMNSGVLDGLSIGYVAQEVEYVRGKKEQRILKKVDLREVSIVTFPMNKASTVEAVKSIEEIKNLADAEAYLREVAGFSQRQAVAFVSRCKGVRPGDPEDQIATDAIASLRQFGKPTKSH